jgi:hypothetical protein
MKSKGVPPLTSISLKAPISVFSELLKWQEILIQAGIVNQR